MFMSELQFNLPESYNTAIENIDTYIKPDKNPKISAEELNTTLKSSVNVFNNVYADINNLATTVSGLQAKDYLTIKGSLESVDKLPTTDNNIGDLYFINTDEYIWSGTEWVCLGPLITVPAYTVRITIPASSYSGHQPSSGWSTFNISQTDIEKFEAGEVTSVIVDDQKNKIIGVAPASFYQVTNPTSFVHNVISFSLPCSASDNPAEIKLRSYSIYTVYTTSTISKPVKITWKETTI